MSERENEIDRARPYRGALPCAPEIPFSRQTLAEEYLDAKGFVRVRFWQRCSECGAACRTGVEQGTELCSECGEEAQP